MECPEDEGVDMLADLPGRWYCQACGRGWRIETTSGELVRGEDP